MDNNTLTFLILTLFINVSVSICQNINDTDTLSRNLYQLYNKNTRPTTDEKVPTRVNYMFYLENISEFDEKKGKLSIVGFFTMIWKDMRMSWNSSSYNGVQSIIFSEKDVWKPPILLSNSHDELYLLGKDSFHVRYISDGTGIWYPGDIFKSSCVPDIYKYPYDSQLCTLIFSPWTYSSLELNLRASEDTVDQIYYTKHGIWDLESTEIYTENVPEFQEEYIYIELKLTRRPAFYLVNVILPIVSLGVLNMFVFALPVESGERVGYSLTVLLAIAIFQTIASDNLPSVSSPNVSLLCVKLLADVLVSSLITLFVIIGLRFYHASEKQPIPGCIAKVTRTLACCCINKTKYRHKIDILDETRSPNEKAIEDIKCDRNEKNEITWADVGIASDVIFTIISFLAFITTNFVYVILIHT